MEIHKIHCREHGGYFTRPARRGRPPVSCSEDNPCDATKRRANAKAVAERTARTLQGEMPRRVGARKVETVETEPKPGTARAAVRETRRRIGNASAQSTTIAKAKAAKEQLEGVGWNTAGKGWEDPDGRYTASLTATRGQEMLLMVWTDGKLVSSDYQLWATDKPSKNGKMPGRNLPFDPDEIPDSELAQLLVGTRVTWWNRLANSEENAVAGKDKVEIMHSFSATGDETPGQRMIRFCDPTSSGYRQFRLDQLLRIG
jgi:hypothetical protein